MRSAVLLLALAGCATPAAVATLTDPAGVPVVGHVDEDLDGGADAGVTLQQLHQLAADYHCPAAEPAVELADGGRYDSPARASREDCLLSRAAAEVMLWRSLADAGALQTPAQPQPTAVDWTGALGALLSAAAAIALLFKK